MDLFENFKSKVCGFRTTLMQNKDGKSMKKINIPLIVLITALIFVSASVWEGSAAVSAAGEFPEGAYYVATDSFPRNTVVDVTNLENGRTIRVIVAAGLDSPGLLAMLSRNAAFAIGIQSRGIGRIRMTQPSDPVAYSRFTEDRELAGNPELAQSRSGTAPVVSSPIRTARVEDLVSSTPEDRFYSSIINKPETYNPPPVEFPSDGSVHTEARPTWLPEEGEPAPLIAEVPVPETIPDPVPENPLIAVPAPEPASPPPVLVAPAPQPPVATLVPPPPPPVITLVPAEERPPHGAVTITSETEVTPIPPSDVRKPSKDDTYLDPRFFIGPIPPLQRPVPRSAPPAAISPAPAPRAVPAPNEPVFSVPVNSQLEGGKYYIQIGAFSQPDTLEVAVARVNKSYPLIVQPGGSPNNIVYRLLIGPLNVGESGAVLQRVKSTGYPDAFVRYQ
jgi:hypothetical protein